MGRVQRCPKAGADTLNQVELGGHNRVLLPCRPQEFIVVPEKPRAQLELEQPRRVQRPD